MTGFSHTAVELFDAGFGPFMVPVEPRTKTPAKFIEGNRWRKVSSVTAFCASREEAIEWDAAGASVGLRGGDFFLWIDNDFGKIFTRLIEHAIHDLGVVGLRRFVDSPRHRRDAFLVSCPAPNQDALAQVPRPGARHRRRIRAARFGPTGADHRSSPADRRALSGEPQAHPDRGRSRSSGGRVRRRFSVDRRSSAEGSGCKRSAGCPAREVSLTLCPGRWAWPDPRRHRRRQARTSAWRTTFWNWAEVSPAFGLSSQRPHKMVAGAGGFSLDLCRIGLPSVSR